MEQKQTITVWWLLVFALFLAEIIFWWKLTEVMFWIRQKGSIHGYHLIDVRLSKFGTILADKEVKEVSMVDERDGFKWKWNSNNCVASLNGLESSIKLNFSNEFIIRIWKPFARSCSIQTFEFILIEQLSAATWNNMCLSRREFSFKSNSFVDRFAIWKCFKKTFEIAAGVERSLLYCWQQSHIPTLERSNNKHVTFLNSYECPSLSLSLRPRFWSPDLPHRREHKPYVNNSVYHFVLRCM